MAMDCPTCGRPNADGKDFCDCGEYLRWDPTGVFAIPAQSAGVAAAPPAPAHATSAPPTPIPTEPVLLVLRAPGGAPGEGPPTVALAVATSGLLQGFVRNQTKRVDSYALRVNGIPEAWVEISPPSVDLLPYGASGDAHESHFLVTITPPRDPSSRAGRHDFRLEAVSRATGAVVASAPGAIEILPYYELELDALPEVRGGRRRVRFTATAATTGNAPLEVELGARDREERFDLSFSPPRLVLEPNTPTDAQLTAKPRRPHWIGRPREHTLAVTAHAPGVPPPPTQIVAVRQRAWLPFWLPPLLALVAALAAAFVLTRPETATMPRRHRRDVQCGTARHRPREASPRPPSSRRGPARRRAARSETVVEPASRPRGEDARPDAKLDPRGRRGPRADPSPGPQGPRHRQGADRAAQGQAQARSGERGRRQGRRGAPGPAAGRAGPRRHRRHDLARDAGEAADARTAAGGDRRDPALAGRPAHARDRRHKGHLDRPARNDDSLRLNAAPGDADPTWLGEQVVFQRAHRLFVVDADDQAEPEPLTEDEGWSSPTALAGTLAAVHDEQICVRVTQWKCRALAGVERIAWGSEGASLAALVDGKVVRFAADGDDPATWPAPEEIGTVEDARDVAVSPEGVIVVSTAAGLERAGEGPILPDIDEACGIDFLDATRLAVAAGASAADARIRLADIESGATRALDGDTGAHFAFK